MATPWVVRVLFVVGLATGNLAHAMEPAFGSPPSAFFYDEDFEGVHGIPASWQVALGTWQADGQTYNSTTPTSAALTTIFEYPPIDQPGDITDQFDFDDFTLTARLRNQGGSASTLVGLVYLYSDPANYFEVAFSPTGIAYLRRMGGGQMETLAAATYPGGGQGVWFSVELHRTADTTSVSVNGVPVFTKTIQRSGARGQVGLSTYNTTARFNKVSLSIPFGQQPFTEDFSDGVADGFISAPNTFVVSNGTYVDTAVHATDQAFAPIDFGVDATMLFNYVVHVRMFNPYSGPGNLVGLLYQREPVNGQLVDHEVVFSPTGVAQLRRIVGGKIEVLSTASHTVGPRTWFTVTLINSLGGLSVAINGEPVFTHESAGQFNGRPLALALVTHWTPARFDDFDFGYVPPVTASRETFNSAVAANDVQSGTWNTQAGTLNNESVGAADIALPGRHSGAPNYSYKARLLNQWGGSGNRVGLVFSYASAEDYLEVIFAQTGQAYLNLYMEGTRYTLATATHSIQRNVWFNVEVIRKGTTATVRLNNAPLFQNVQIGQIPEGFFGVVSHFSQGHFDNLELREVP